MGSSRHASYNVLHAQIADADGVLIVAPIYNWGLGSGVKTIIELTGAYDGATRRAAWFDKLVTFLCAGGLPHSYMAYLPIAAGLMLDVKCVLNPYLVYASERDWTADGEPSGALRKRLAQAVAVKLELAAALRHRSYHSDWKV